MPLLAMFLDIKFVIPLVAIFNVLNSMVLFLKLRGDIEYKDVLALLIFTLFGIPFGIYLLRRCDENVIKTILGLILIIYSLYSLSFNIQGLKLSKRTWAYPIGFLGGCLGGAFNTSGPPVIVYMSLKPWSKDRIKGTLQGYFLASSLMIVLFHAFSGITTFAVVKTFLLFSPFLIGGVLTGCRLYDYIDTALYRKIVFVLLAILGVVLVISSHRMI